MQCSNNIAGLLLDLLDLPCSIWFIRLPHRFSINNIFSLLNHHSGIIVGCTNPVLLDMLGLQCLSQAFSLVSALRGVAAMAGPPVAGVLVDRLESPEVAVYLCGGLMVSAVILATVSWIIWRILVRRENYIEI